MVGSIRISENGELLAIYDDAHPILYAGGNQEIRRASHVEPDGRGGWTADMSPYGGSVLGTTRTRAESLQAETDWLTREIIER